MAYLTHFLAANSYCSYATTSEKEEEEIMWQSVKNTWKKLCVIVCKNGIIAEKKWPGWADGLLHKFAQKSMSC
jgi:hypothetical protein